MWLWNQQLDGVFMISQRPDYQQKYSAGQPVLRRYSESRSWDLDYWWLLQFFQSSVNFIHVRVIHHATKNYEGYPCTVSAGFTGSLTLEVSPGSTESLQVVKVSHRIVEIVQEAVEPRSHPTHTFPLQVAIESQAAIKPLTILASPFCNRLEQEDAKIYIMWNLGLSSRCSSSSYIRWPAQHRREFVDKAVNPWRSLETYSYNKYHPMGEIYQWMNQISAKYTDMVTQHFLGMTETWPMYYLKISQPANNPKKIIWMDCGLRAREWIAPTSCQWFILQNYQDNSRIRRFLKNLDFYVLPVLNVDGYIYSWTTDRFWGKSHLSHNNGTCFGTDLNQNFNVSWCNVGASKNCPSLTFCEMGPVSEPETKAVSSFIESKKEDILCFLTIYSYGQLIVTYGYTSNKSSNHEELIQVGQKAANALKAKYGTNYRVGSSVDILYATSGSLRDWAQDIGILFSYTFELGDNGAHGFVLPVHIQATCEETMEAVLSILDDVCEKFRCGSPGKVTSTTVVLSLLPSLRSFI
ncbi:LOW QUALITY PROTEIN: carboxypeptidase O [Rhynchonycteris naso]